MGTSRVFIAIPVPVEIQQAMVDLQKRLRGVLPQIRWTKPEGMHLTLKFLGDVEDHRSDQIEKALSEITACQQAFLLHVKGIGCFPPQGMPRVLWVGFQEETGSLTRLQATVEEAMEGISFPRERRGFTPHLTLGRIPDLKNARGLREMLVAEHSTSLGEFDAFEVHIVKSLLTPQGAIYTTLATMRLMPKPSKFTFTYIKETHHD
jgi:2'-5' RNA ligase